MYKNLANESVGGKQRRQSANLRLVASCSDSSSTQHTHSTHTQHHTVHDICVRYLRIMSATDCVC